MESDPLNTSSETDDVFHPPISMPNGTSTPPDLSPDFALNRKMRSPELVPRRLSHDPFGDNYSDSEKEDENDDEGSVISDVERRNTGLKREVGFAGCLSLVIGVMIGSGIFASPSVIFSQANSAGMSLIVWAGCGVLCMLAALCYAELGTAIKSSGGEKTYLSRSFGVCGPLIGFLYSWTAILIVKPASLAGVSMAFSAYILEPFYRGEDPPIWLEKVISASGIAVILVVNCLSVKWATLMQVFFTAAKMIAIGMLIITGFVRLGQGHDENFKNAFNNTNTGVSSIGYAFYGGLWAYDGWNNLNYVTEELKNPIRDLPLAIMIGIPLVTCCYVMVNVAYLTVMTSAEIAKSNAVAVTLGYDLYGKMAWIIPFLVACSTFGAANGSAFTSGRLVYVSAREGHMPKLLAMVHKKRHTPLPALIFTCFIAWIMLIPESSNFASLVNYFNFAAWTFYGATIAALLWLRFKEPNLKRPYKVFIGIPIIVLLCSIYLVAAPFYDYPKESSYCLLFILLGIPVYFAFVKFRIFPKQIYNGFDFITSKIERLCNLSMPSEGPADEIDAIKEEQQQKNGKYEVPVESYKQTEENM